MKRAIMAAMLMLMPAASFAIPPDHPLAIPKVPQLSLVPTRIEMEVLRQRKLERDWRDEVRTMPQFRGPRFGDYEQELMWATSPFGSPYPLITIFSF